MYRGVTSSVIRRQFQYLYSEGLSQSRRLVLTQRHSSRLITESVGKLSASMSTSAKSTDVPAFSYLRAQAFQPQITPPLILVVDDEASFRWMVRKALEAEGYRVIEAANGAECLQVYQVEQPNLILMDAVMPVMDGFTCCCRLSALADSTSMPILIVTSLDDRESIDRAFTAGATDYITKPVQWAVLRQRVKRLIQQSQLYQQVQQFNIELDLQVQACSIEIHDRTTQLHRALEFESTLKRITDKVRDSLDEEQILQTAVRELAWALDVGCCNAALYDPDEGTSSVRYEYTASIAGYHNRTIAMDSCPELYQQIWQGEHFQFCSITPSPVRGRVAMFACPMMNGEHPIGDLWLINPEDRVLNELEIRLVQQVANQCAIAIRQARLYQAAQTQVKELEKLNLLKDDFLSTVSHELRTPLANMRLAIQMLEHTLGTRPESSHYTPKAVAYLQILHDECEREISLINDLLDLQRFESSQPCATADTIVLDDWLPTLVTPFQERAIARQQTLRIDIQSALPAIVSDPDSLKRILAELLNNACKYTPPRGSITLTVEANRAALHDPTICFQIRNSGIEIPSQEMQRIFDKFYRVPSGDPWKQGGTGLGLALVKRLVTHLRGTIGVESAAGQTCFTVCIPLT